MFVNEIQEDGEADFVVPLQLFQLGDLARERVGVEFLNYIILHVSDFFLVRLLGWIVGAGNDAKNLESGTLALMASTLWGLLR